MDSKLDTPARIFKVNSARRASDRESRFDLRRVTAQCALGIAAAALLAACSPTTTGTMAGSGSRPAASIPATSGAPTSAAPQTFSQSVPPAPKPDGKYSGTCDYTLSPSFSYAHAGDFVGQVRLHNTGNVGITMVVRMQWAQLGYGPVRIVKKARLRVGLSRTVRFHKLATSQMIDRYQSVDNSIAGSACHFKATIIDTFGQAR